LGNKFLAASGIYFLASMVPKLTAMILLPVRTHYLQPAEFGVLGTLASISGFIQPLLLLGTTGAVVRAYYEKEHGEEWFKGYLMSTWIGIATFATLVCLLLEIAGFLFWSYTPLAEKIPFHPFVSVTLLKVWLSVLGASLLLPVFRAMQRPILFASFALGGWFFTLALGLYGLVHAGLLGQVVYELPATFLTASVAVYFLLKMFGSKDVKWSHLKAALAFGLPLIPHMLALWVMNLSDRILLASMVPMEDVGLYNIAMSLAITMVFVISSLNEAWVPRYYQLMSKEERDLTEVRRYSEWWLLGMGIICLGMMLFSTDIIHLLTSDAYANSSRFIPIMAYSFLVMGIYHFGVNPLFYHKKTKWIPWVSGGAALLNILLNLILIPRLGAVGAALSTLLAQGFMATVFHRFIRKYDPMPYPYLKGLLLVVSLGGLAAWLTFGTDVVILPFTIRFMIALGMMAVFVPVFLNLKKMNEV